jgi:hypothetical protein
MCLHICTAAVRNDVPGNLTRDGIGSGTRRRKETKGRESRVPAVADPTSCRSRHRIVNFHSVLEAINA